jgi:hypothetical protein
MISTADDDSELSRFAGLGALAGILPYPTPMWRR